MSYRISSAFVAVATVATFAACGSADKGTSSGGGSASGGTKDALKVALIPPTSGALAPFGADAAAAWKFAAAEVNAKGGIDGHKVELVESETDGQPPTTVRAARKAVTQDGVNFIGAVMTSPEHGALQQQLPALNALSFNGLGKDDALTGAGCSPNAYRAVQSNDMDVNAIAQSLKQFPAKRWAVQGVDYSTGHSAANKFKAAAKAAGKDVVVESYAPLGTTDFGSYITKLKSSGADALFAAEFGADAVAFINQGAQFKLFDKFDTVLGLNMVSEPLFKPLGNKITGFYNTLGYDVASENPMNQSFVDGYTKSAGKAPYYVVADNYLAAQLLFEGVRKAGSVDPAKVKAALKGISFDSIVGNVNLAEDNQLVRDTYIAEVVKSGSGLGWKLTTKAAGSTVHPAADPACKA